MRNLTISVNGTHYLVEAVPDEAPPSLVRRCLEQAIRGLPAGKIVVSSAEIGAGISLRGWLAEPCKPSRR